MPNIVIKVSCTVLVLLAQNQIVFSQGKVAEQVREIKLDAIDHHTFLFRKDLQADPRFELPAFMAIDHLREGGRIYLRCKSTGMVVCAVPAKDSYHVLVFPRKQSEHFKLQIATSAELLRDCVDVKSIESLLSSVRPNSGMGSQEQVRLKIRIEASEEPGGLGKP